MKKYRGFQVELAEALALANRLDDAPREGDMSKAADCIRSMIRELVFRRPPQTPCLAKATPEGK